jgi:hypothetical protein
MVGALRRLRTISQNIAAGLLLVALVVAALAWGLDSWRAWNATPPATLRYDDLPENDRMAVNACAQLVRSSVNLSRQQLDEPPCSNVPPGAMSLVHLRLLDEISKDSLAHRR